MFKSKTKAKLIAGEYLLKIILQIIVKNGIYRKTINIKINRCNTITPDELQHLL